MKSLLIILFYFLSSVLSAQYFEQANGLSSQGPCEAVFVNDDVILASVANKLYRSTDNGASFEYISVGSEGDVTPRTFCQTGDVIIMGAINGDRIYRSLDNGNSWEVSNTGGPEISGFPAAVPITSDVLDGVVFMCGTNFIRKSSDLGLTWEIMDIDGLCLDVSVNGSDVWAAPSGNLHKSVNQGGTWEDVPDEGIFFSNAAEDVLESQGRIFVGTALSAGNGLYVSDDGGMSYQLNGNFSVAKDLLKVNDDLYISSIGGLGVSSDNGNTWAEIPGVGGLVGYSGDMTFDGNQTIWIASTNGLYSMDILTQELQSYPFPVGEVNQVAVSNSSYYGIQGTEAFQSADGGNTWANLNGTVLPDDLNVIDVFADGNEIYISGSINFNPVLYQSLDDGATFTELSLPNSVTQIEQVLSYNPVVITSFSGGFISFDNGLNFDQIDLNGIDGVDIPDDIYFKGITQNGSSIFLTGVNGVAYSHDDGASWTYIEMSGVQQFSGWNGRLVINKSTPWPPFVTEESTDGGASWTPIEGVETQFSGPEFMWMMNDTLYLQNDQQNALAGEFNKLGEMNAEWSLAPWLGSIPDQVVSASTNDMNQTILGTRNSAAWIAGSTNTSVQNLDLIDLNIYPNPSEGVLHFTEVPISTIEIFSLSGIKVKTILPAESIQINDLNSGIYLLCTEVRGRKVKVRLVIE